MENDLCASHFSEIKWIADAGGLQRVRYAGNKNTAFTPIKTNVYFLRHSSSYPFKYPRQSS